MCPALSNALAYHQIERVEVIEENIFQLSGERIDIVWNSAVD